MKVTLHLHRFLSVVICLAMALSLLPLQLGYAASPDVVISQVYGGGGNSGATYTNDFVELFNRGTATISLDGWSIQYASATGTGNFGSSTTMITPLSGSLASGQYMLIQEAQGSGGTTPLPTPDVTDSSPIAMSATGGKVALVMSATGLGCNGGSTLCSAAQLALITDLVGWDGANFYEGSGPAPATSNSTAIFRSNGGCTDSDNNNADFDPAAAPSPRNTASPFHYCSGPIDPTGVGAAVPNVLFAGDPTFLTVAVTPGANPPSTGLAVTCDLSAIGGSTSQAFYDDGTSGDVAAGDNMFSYSTDVAAEISEGSKSLACTVSDAETRSSSASIALTVTVILPIGTVNGTVPDSDSCAAHVSPYVNQYVAIQGVIYEKTLQAISNSTNTYKGFYIQNTAATADSDPTTSDGLFVFMSTYTTLIGGYAPQVGDEVVIYGRISEYYNMTELLSVSMLKLVDSDVDIETEVPPVVANPPVSLANANCYWERLQGMRVQVPQNSIVLGGRNVFNPADAEIWVARPDSTIAQRSDPYTRRAFRDAHPLDDNYDPNNWDGNGYRILMGSLGIKADEGDAQALIDPARTFDTLTNAPAGGLNYTYSKYRIEISEQPTFTEGVDPAQNNPPVEFDRSRGYSIADYNLENLYDYRNNPLSGCDFAGDTGCPKVAPFLAAVSSPFDYVPASDAAYQARLNDIALQIIEDLHSPDILMVQEVENQDICKVDDGEMVCKLTDASDADGQPDVLQDLALKIAAYGGPAYAAAFDPDSSDLRGILPAFLYRTDRVQLVSPVGDPVLGETPAIGSYTAVPYDENISNPKTLNAVYTGSGACETSWVFPRAPSVALFRMYSTSIGVGSYRDIYVINNHFKSGPDTCVAHRTEQANYNAALVAYIEAANPYARIVLGGDLNVYPRPDDPFAPTGQPGSSDQLGSLYDPGLGLTNLWDVLLDQAPEAAYSYVYVGMAQTLDQMFVNQTMLADLNQFRIAHINSDFPADYPTDVARGSSDHDPNVATFGINFTGFFMPVENPPATNTIKAGQIVPVKFSLGGFKGLDIFAAGYPVSQQIACDTGALLGDAEETMTAGASGLNYDPATDTYVYIWKTDKDWAGSCRQLTVMLNDGTVQPAIFTFTR
jgi:predicted extracellular nuclease